MTMLTLPQVGCRIAVADGQTILDAALSAGMPIPIPAAPAAAAPASQRC